MNMKRLRALMALTLTAVLVLCACGKQEQTPAAQEPPAQTTASAPGAARELSLTQSNLGVTTWSSPNGATVNLTAVPSEHDKGDSAEFVVRLGEEDVASVPCEWKDNAYTASADLNAANGYGYYVRITGKDGASAEIPVNTPEAPVDETLIDLASSLMPYCSLTLNDAELQDSDLTVLSGYALVQAPVITKDGENVACAQATLVLALDGQEVASVALTMAPGEADRSYDAAITDMSFTLPDSIAEGQQLVLRLDAVLTDGQKLTAQGGSWTVENGSVASVVG